MAEGTLHPNEIICRLLLKLPRRRHIYEAIVAAPGTHVRRLSRDLNLALGVVEHHLRVLHEHQLIFSYQVGRRRTYYASGQVDPEDVQIIHALRKPLWATIVQALLDSECGVVALAKKLDMEPANLSYHLRRLAAKNLVANFQVGRESIYLLREPERARRLIAVWNLASQGHDETFSALASRACQNTEGWLIYAKN